MIGGVTAGITRRKIKIRTGVCRHCGAPFSQVGSGRPKAACSRKCREALSLKAKRLERGERACVRCGSPTPDWMRRYCGPECLASVASARSIMASAEWRMAHPIVARACAQCGTEFTPRSSHKHIKYCSKTCRLEAFNASPERQGKSHHRRAMKYGVEYQEIRREDVFERDGWRCQICGRKTPPERSGTKHANAPELDHRVPMSRGGGHTFGNVQCACRACNVKKSNREECGQVPLWSDPRALRIAG